MNEKGISMYECFFTQLRRCNSAYAVTVIQSRLFHSTQELIDLITERKDHVELILSLILSTEGVSL